MSANTKIILPWIFSINLDNFFRLLVHTKSNEWNSAYNWFVFDIFQTETCISLTARIIDSPLFFWLVSPTRSRANGQLFPMWTIQEQRQRSWMKGELRKAIEQENTLRQQRKKLTRQSVTVITRNFFPPFSLAAFIWNLQSTFSSRISYALA